MAVTLSGGRNCLIKLNRLPLMPPFLGDEKKALILVGVVVVGDIDRPAQRETFIVFLIKRRALGLIEEISRVQVIVTKEEIRVPVKLWTTALGLNQNRSRRAAAVHGAVVRSQNLHLPDRIDAWEYNQRAGIPIDACV